MDKPKPKREVAIRGYSKLAGVIFFDSSQDAADEFQEFGYIIRSYSEYSYTLYIDARFDFGEVLAYVENYG